MQGCNAGVGERLQNGDLAVPHLIRIHCLAHRLELALKAACKNTYLSTIEDTLKGIYKLYSNSPKLLAEMKELAELLEENVSKPGKIQGIRWVDHKKRAMAVMEKNWKTIVKHLENIAAADNQYTGELRAKARGFLNVLKSFKFVLYQHFFQDILNEVAKVSLLFQRDSVVLQQVIVKLESAILSITNQGNNHGHKVREFYNSLQGEAITLYKGEQLTGRAGAENDFMARRGVIVATILECINNRFMNLHADEKFQACQTLDVSNWPDTMQELAAYGDPQLQILKHHFEELLTTNGYDANLVSLEWGEAKVDIHQHYRAMGLQGLRLWQRMHLEKSDRYPNFLALVKITQVYPLSTACCERGFSCMSRIKDDWRCALRTETLDMLMRLSIEGPPLNDFIPRRAVNRWWLRGRGERARRPNIEPYGPRPGAGGPDGEEDGQ